jgi:hypothetical protein
MKINDVVYRPLIHKGTPTRYLISEFGDIINAETNKQLAPLRSVDGRKRIGISVDGEICRDYVHRLVYESFYGPIPPNMTINHIDENSQNNHYTNLELMTRTENTKSYIRNNGPQLKRYSDSVIEEVCEELKAGNYFRDVAAAFGMPTDYVFRLMTGAHRKFITQKYLPFPESAHRAKPLRKIPHEYIDSMIIRGFSTHEILQAIGFENEFADRQIITRRRKRLGVSDPQYFSQEFLALVEKLITAGNSNSEIYEMLGLEYSSRLGYLLARKRSKLGIPDFNEKGVPLYTQEEILGDIRDGCTNKEIFSKYNLVRSPYTIAMMARLRQKVKNRGSTTIESIA